MLCRLSYSGGVEESSRFSGAVPDRQAEVTLAGTTNSQGAVVSALDSASHSSQE